MKDRIRQAFDSDTFRKEAHSLVDKLADYLAQATAGKMPVVAWRDPKEAEALWKNDFSRPPADLDLDSVFSDILRDSMHLHHPGYVGHQMSPCLPLGALCDLLTSVLNNSAAIYEMGPVGTMVEREVTKWMTRTLGMGDDSDGVFTSGGTLANLTALLAARQQRAGGKPWKEGTSDKEKLCLLVSDQIHYSVDRAVRIMGWGDEGLERVPVDAHFKMRPEKLEESLARAKQAGKRVVAVVANACSTATGAYDPIPAIADFCKKNKLWLHVDGAHGASVALSAKYRGLLEGIGRADSVVWDAHKLLLMPALTSVALFKRRQDSIETFSQQASYIFQKSAQEEWFNLSHRTLECTKRDYTFRLYVVLRAYGTDFLGEYVERLYDLAKEFAKEIAATADFEMPVPPQANIICFRYRGKDDKFQAELRRKVIASGKFYLVQTTLPQGVYLRTTLMNPFTTLEDLKGLLALVRAIAQSA